MSNQLTQYLNELRSELDELYVDFDNEIRSEENQDLTTDAYNGVGKQLEDALESLNALINDIENGVYEKTLDTETFEEEEDF